MLALAAVVLAGHALWAYAQERHDLPPFDAAKTPLLSHEKRAEYERLLFNEIPPHNAGSFRHDIWSREKEWLRMADEGFELAYITLQVLSPTKGKFALDKPLNRLEALAGQGDASAMCLYRQLVTWGQQRPSDFEKYNPKAVEYMEKGVSLGHPECLATKGAILLRAPDATKEDRQKGFEMLARAARAEYAGGAYGLVGHFLDKNAIPKNPPPGFIGFTWAYEDIPATERQYCWEAIIEANYGWSSNNPQLRYNAVERYAKRHHKEELMALVRKLKETNFTLESCIALGLGE